ncbi:hypothetical protein B0J17DRAFT_672552 [Rhizoctonia solani]|nr:hypothetical protein B0J17DRAFT_672552 [Rhizoctonia solani]
MIRTGCWIAGTVVCCWLFLLVRILIICVSWLEGRYHSHSVMLPLGSFLALLVHSCSVSLVLMNPQIRTHRVISFFHSHLIYSRTFLSSSFRCTVYR